MVNTFMHKYTHMLYIYIYIYIIICICIYIYIYYIYIYIYIYINMCVYLCIMNSTEEVQDGGKMC